MSKKIVIAIDGLVATGKWTTAKGVAHQLGYMYLDTGAMYRAVTLYALRHQMIDADHDAKTSMMQGIHLDFVYNSTTDRYDIVLNGENVEQIIRSTEVSMMIYKIADVVWIRHELKLRQQEYGREWGIVADGRDMGTVVFPDAPLKFFLTCDKEVRARRRLEQKLAMGLEANLEAIIAEIDLRDREDYLAPHAINKKADDAIELDTTKHTIESQIALIVKKARAVIDG